MSLFNSISISLSSGLGRTVPNRFTNTFSDRQVLPLDDLSDLTALGGPGAVSTFTLGLNYDSSGIVDVRSVDEVTGEVVTPLVELGSLSGGSVSGSFSMKEHGGWQTIQAFIGQRKISETTVRIGAGIVIGIEGQSQARGFITNNDTGGNVVAGDLVSAYGRSGLLSGVGSPSSVPGTDAAYGQVGWYWLGDTVSLDDVVVLSGGGDGAAIAGNLLVQQLNVPVAFVANAVGGYSIQQLNFATPTNNALARYQEVGGVHYITMLYQGTADVSAGTSQANYVSRYGTWRTNRTANAYSTPKNKWMMFPLGRQNVGTPTATETIRAAQMEIAATYASDTLLGADNYDLALQADNIHILAGNTGCTLMGRRFAASILYDLGVGSVLPAGPELISVARSGATVTCTFDLHGATSLERCDVTGTTLTSTGFGFRRISDNSVLSTTGTPVISTSTVTFTLSSDPGSAVRVRYGATASPGPATVGDNSRVASSTKGIPVRFVSPGIDSPT